METLLPVAKKSRKGSKKFNFCGSIVLYVNFDCKRIKPSPTDALQHELVITIILYFSMKMTYCLSFNDFFIVFSCCHRR